jgi:hypothetical protein
LKFITTEQVKNEVYRLYKNVGYPRMPQRVFCAVAQYLPCGGEEGQGRLTGRAEDMCLGLARSVPICDVGSMKTLAVDAVQVPENKIF